MNKKKKYISYNSPVRIKNSDYYRTPQFRKGGLITTPVSSHRGLISDTLNLPTVNIKGLPKRYLEAVRQQRMSDSISTAAWDNARFEDNEFYNDGDYSRYATTWKDPLHNKYSRQVGIANELWDSVDDSMISYTPNRGIQSVNRMRRLYPGSFNEDYGVEPTGYQYKYGTEGVGTYAPQFDTNLENYRTKRMKSRDLNIDIRQDGSTAPITKEIKTNPIPKRPIRYKRKGHRNYAKFVQDEEGNIIESVELTPKQYWKEKPEEINYGGGYINRRYGGNIPASPHNMMKQESFVDSPNLKVPKSKQDTIIDSNPISVESAQPAVRGGNLYLDTYSSGNSEYIEVTNEDDITSYNLGGLIEDDEDIN